MGIDTKESRAALQRAEAGSREARIRAYEEKMGVQLPYSPVAMTERKPVRLPAQVLESNSGNVSLTEQPIEASLESNKSVRGLAQSNTKFDKVAYQREYMRKRRAKAKL